MDILHDKINDDTFKDLLDKGRLNMNHANKKYFSNTLLMTLISNGKSKIAIELLDKFNANPFVPDNFDKNALQFLIYKGHKKESKQLKILKNCQL